MTPADRAGAAEATALAAIVLSSHDAVIAKTVNGIVTAWNEGATLVYGYSAEEMLGESIEKTFPAESLQEERVRHARVATGDAESGYRCWRIHRDGHPIEVVMSMSPVRDEEGQVVGVASISRPTSDRERADSRFASVLEAAPDAMVCVDRAGRIALANAQASAMFDYPLEQILGAELESLLPEGLRERHVAYRAEFARDPKVRTMGSGLSLLARRRDGSTFPVEVSLSPDRGSGDGLVIAAVRDVTEQRALELASRESESRLRQLAESIDIVLLLLQFEPLEYLYVSPNVQRLFGVDAESIRARSPDDVTLVHPDDVAGFRDRYVAAAVAGQSVEYEHRVVRAGGEVEWVRLVAMPVPNPDGSPVRSVVTIETITDRVEAAQALRDAEAAARAASDAKNEFLSRMSHELRTPLNAVLGFGQLLEHNLKGTEQAADAQQVVRAGRHLLDLINEVLDIARIEAGETSVSLEAVSVSDVINEAVSLMQPLAADADVTITVSGGPEGCHLRADLQRLRQILLNLISNAVKYNRPGGGVWLSWAVEGTGQTVIRVRDNGVGIAEQFHDRLFTPFDRLGAEGGSVEGTGVGLTVTRGLAELMQGSLGFDSAAGLGTTFTVTLPSADAPIGVLAETRVEPETVPEARPSATATTTLLYIDDNEPNVKVMESILKLRPHWRFIHAGLASLGIELAFAHLPDLILLDVHLPDASGADVLRALKSAPDASSIPVIVLSADASSQQISRLLEAGAARYLTKPLDLDEVLDVLDGISPTDS